MTTEAHRIKVHPVHRAGPQRASGHVFLVSDGETEAQREAATCPNSRSKLKREPELARGSSDTDPLSLPRPSVHPVTGGLLPPSHLSLGPSIPTAKPLTVLSAFMGPALATGPRTQGWLRLCAHSARCSYKGAKQEPCEKFCPVAGGMDSE